MQAQSVNTGVQNVTLSQSLTAVQTLLKAGLGCITYLRDLLPVDNFHESHFTSSSEDSSRNASIDTDNAVDKRFKRNVSAFKIMTVTRGFTEEADKLLNYLEYGIFDALKKQYLRSFIFAIYLDNKDPNNIVEAYTFNFDYHNVPGTDTMVPIMNFIDVSTKSSNRNVDPVTEAAKRGLPPTLGEVKKSVKSLLRRLVNATTQMDVLPKRRYATFKLFYYDNTPSDYEPPHFLPGDAIKDRWFFTTHGKEEIPEKWSLGGFHTGHHGVNISIASVAGYLPSSNEDNEAIFTGITTKPPGMQSSVPGLTPAQEAALRAHQIDVQMKDAVARNMVWSVEGHDGADLDAEGEPEEGFIIAADGTYERRSLAHDISLPIGLRNREGLIEPFSLEKDEQRRLNGGQDAGMDIDSTTQSEALFGGQSESVPSRVGDLNRLKTLDAQRLDQTQQICSTQEPEPLSQVSTGGNRSTPTPNSITDAFANIDISSAPGHRDQSIAVSHDSIDIDTQILQNIAMNAVIHGQDDDISTMNTPVTSPITMDDQIESFTSHESGNMAEDILGTQQSRDVDLPRRPTGDFVDNGLKCECGVAIEDECTFCEGGCGYWYHTWCMGFHSTTDKRIPAHFLCFDCRVHADLNWDLIKVDLYPKMISKFKDLALFRRAIKIVEIENPPNFTRFAKFIGCETVVARQLFKRLELEGFISTETTAQDELSILETTSRPLRNKAKPKGKQRKTLQKAKYTFNTSSKRTSAYRDYFNPDFAVESRMLGLADLKSSFKSLHRDPRTPASCNAQEVAAPVPPHVNESQTQYDTQRELVLSSSPDTRSSCADDWRSKRKMTSVEIGSRRPSKKVKISMGPAVDLGD